VLADSPHELHKFRILRAREQCTVRMGIPARAPRSPRNGGKMRRFLAVPLVVVLAGFPGFAGSGRHFARLAGDQAKRFGYAARTSPIRRDARAGASS
jgi:hypothetical protein